MRKEQEEALSIFIRIHKETGWRIGFIPKDLMEKWGWDSNTDISSPLPTNENPSNHYMNQNKQFTNGSMSNRSNYSAPMFDQYAENQRQQQEARQQAMASQHRRSQHLSPQTAAHGQQQQNPSPQQRKMPPPGIVNPMFGNADFSGPKHPYQDYYVAPSQPSQQQGQMGLGLALAGIAPYQQPNGGPYQY